MYSPVPPSKTREEKKNILRFTYPQVVAGSSQRSSAVYVELIASIVEIAGTLQLGIHHCSFGFFSIP